MPRNKPKTYRLSAALIEDAHDFGIAVVWPGVEPVGRGTCINLNLLRSAAAQPYQECFGRELYPSLAAKAAYLFIHIASGHLFLNGNKRTAALCLDAFALVNSCFLTLSNNEVHDLAQSVAAFREQGRTFEDVLQETTKIINKNLVPISDLRKIDMTAYRYVHKRKTILRNHLRNRADAPLKQTR